MTPPEGAFLVRLRLDSPLLQGGPEPGGVDPSHRVRGASVRGLMRTFARALFSPLLGGDADQTRRAENLLLGSATGDGSDSGGTATYRVVDISDARLTVAPEHPNRPRPGQKPGTRSPEGSRPGYREGQRCQLLFLPRPGARRADPRLGEALWAVVWTAFSLGGLGGRARRGYGSLTVEAVEGAPDLAPGGLPVFLEYPTRDALRHGLLDGRAKARAVLVEWLRSRGFAGAALDHPHRPASIFEVREGQPGPPERQRDAGLWVEPTVFGDWREAMTNLMEACSDALSAWGAEYEACLGRKSSGGSRLASPLWLRLYRVRKPDGGLGVVPVATYSPYLPEDGTQDAETQRHARDMALDLLIRI